MAYNKTNILLTIIFTSWLVCGLPILNIFNTINVRNIVNLENNENNENNEKSNEKKDDFSVYDYEFMIFEKNYTINAIITKHILIYNSTTQYYTAEIEMSYKNNIDNHYLCKIDINPPKQTSNIYIQNFIYYEYNLGKPINLICNNKKCIHKIYYKHENKFHYFNCDVKYEKNENDFKTEL
jgi:hypothetical protein